MEVKNEIYRYMKELVAIPSISNSREEQAAGEYIREELGRQPYFQAHPELTGMYGLEGDFLSRGTPYGLVKGSTSRTVILTGHYDVVDTEEYGDFQSYCVQSAEAIHHMCLHALDQHRRHGLPHGPDIDLLPAILIKTGFQVHQTSILQPKPSLHPRKKRDGPPHSG